MSEYNLLFETYRSTSPYTVPLMAAMVGIVPAFPLLAAKSSVQVGEPPPKLLTRQMAKRVLRSPLTAGLSVGTQLVTQKVLQQQLGEESVWPAPLAGLASVPGLAMLNGQSLGRGALESLWAMRWNQAAALALRETSFLYSVEACGPIRAWMRERFGERWYVEDGGNFVVGALGSMVNHPADTFLTLSQKGLATIPWSHLMRGVWRRAAGVGLFSVCYQRMKRALTPE